MNSFTWRHKTTVSVTAQAEKNFLLFRRTLDGEQFKSSALLIVNHYDYKHYAKENYILVIWLRYARNGSPEKIHMNIAQI